jgi:hypothetical protein
VRIGSEEFVEQHGTKDEGDVIHSRVIEGHVRCKNESQHGATSVILSIRQHGIRATADIAPLIYSYKHILVLNMMQ